MDRDQLRKMILDGNDRIRRTPLVWNRLTPEQRTLLLASQQFYAQDDAVSNAALDALVGLYNSLQETP